MPKLYKSKKGEISNGMNPALPKTSFCVQELNRNSDCYWQERISGAKGVKGRAG